MTASHYQHGQLIRPGSLSGQLRQLFLGLTGLALLLWLAMSDSTTAGNTLAVSSPPPARQVSVVRSGSAVSETARAVTADSQGQIWITGQHQDKLLLARLNVDNTLSRLTTANGSGTGQGNAIATDGSQRVWVCGETTADDLPLAGTVWQRDRGRRHSGFIARYAGNQLQWQSYLGGDGRSRCQALWVNPDGSGYAAGQTTSASLPRSINSKVGRATSAFIIAFDSAGTIRWSRLIGGNYRETVTAMVVADKQLWLGGWTDSTDLKVTADAWQTSLRGRRDNFIARLSDTGELHYLSYVGGTGEEYDLLLSHDGQHLYLGGSSNSRTLAGTLARTLASAGGIDLYFMQWQDTRPGWQHRYGGSHNDRLYGLIAGQQQELWAVGGTVSTDLPVTPDAAQASLANRGDGLILRLSTQGTRQYSSYLGGDGRDELYGIIAGHDDITLIGHTESHTFPGPSHPPQTRQYDLLIARYTQSNRAPDITSTAVTQAHTGTAYSYAVTAQDPDGDTLNYQLSTAPTGMTIDNSGHIHWQSPQAGSHDITLTVSDARGSNTLQSYTLTVTEPLSITSIAPTEGQVGTLYRYQLSTNGDTVRYQLLVAPTGMSIDSDSGLINWLPDRTGTINVTVQAKDDTATVTQHFSITVVAAPPPEPDPLALVITAPSDGLLSNQATQTITGHLNRVALLTLNNEPIRLDMDNRFSHEIILTEGSNTLSFTARDTQGETVTQTLTLHLDQTAPTITLDSPMDTHLSRETQINFVGQLSEDARLTIHGNPVTLDATYRFDYTLSLTEGQHSITLIATDRAGNRSTRQRTITIDQTAPVLNAVLIHRSNPQQGLIMVSGQAGATEGGALIRLTNPEGNQQHVLSLSNGSFSLNIAAYANQSIDIQATDSAGNTSATLTLAPPGTPSLSLISIGDKTAPLGQTTRFTVSASDSSGQRIELGLSPLPLPAGMTYNIATGEVIFTPQSPGNYPLTFTAESSSEHLSETITVTVPAPIPNAPTTFKGRILDANSYEDGNMVPIIGATVTFLNTGITTTSDNEGYFTLNNLPETAEVFDIDADTAQDGPDGTRYASFREQLTLQAHVLNREERPFFLPRTAMASMTQVNPNQRTMVNNPTLGVTLRIEAGNAVNEDGTPFTGQVSISPVPRNLAPAALPEFLDPVNLFTIQPVGVSYTEPAPITLENIEDYPANAELDLWSLNPDTGEFHIVGVGQVSADGSQITTISGGIRANDWHLVTCTSPSTMGNSNNPDPDNPCPGCPEADGGSSFSLNDGHMSTQFSLPAYRSLETSRALNFSYRSFRAHPQPIIEFSAFNSVRATVPIRVSYQLEVSGLKQGQETFIDSSGFSESLDEPFHIALSFDAEDFNTGMHNYKLTVTNHFRGGARVSLIQDGRIMVDNQQASPFGAGWMLHDLYHLAFNPEDDNSITLMSPNGNSLTYRTDGNGDYTSPANDYATFTKNPDGSYTHTEKDGTRMHFNAQGQLLRHEDRNSNTTTYAYNTDGTLATITDPVGLITRLTYNNNGQLQSITDPAGRTSTFTIDARGDLTQITYPDGTSQTFEYDDRHLMTAKEDERGNRSTDTYDSFGRVTQATLPDGTVRQVLGRSVTSLIDLNGGMGTVDTPAPITRPEEVDGEYTDGRGYRSSKTLDSHGRALMEVDELGRVTMHERDADSNPTRTTRPIGSTVTRTFDDFGNVLTQREDFNQASTSYQYDNFSLMTQMTNPRGNTTTIQRDSKGNPTLITNAAGHQTTMQYNTQGLVTRMVSPNGLVTTYTYNANGLMTNKTETPPGTTANVRTTTYSYYPTGLLQSTTTPDGITLTYSYDDRNTLLSVTDNLNQSIVYTYDEHKNIIRTETKNSDNTPALQTDNSYDSRNRLIQTSMPAGLNEQSITQRLLDENSNLIQITDPNGNLSSNSYDPFNRLQRNTHREAGITRYQYDAQDRIIQVTAPNGVITKYEYDIISRRTKEISTDRGTIRYSYDLANNVTGITEARGITSTMTYDELERITSKTYPNTITGKNENVTYTYDGQGSPSAEGTGSAGAADVCQLGIGRLCSRTDESGTYNYSYDIYGNVLSMNYIEKASTRQYTTSYVYDNGNNITQMTYPSGRVITYSRDGVRRIAGINTTLNNQAQNIVNDIAYRGDNQMLSCTYGNGLNDIRSYDLQGRLTSQRLFEPTADDTLDQRTYSYDKNSNILSVNINGETTEYDRNYIYDRLDRLTSDKVGEASATATTFGYDQNDNRLSRSLEDLTLEELIDYETGSNRIENISTLKRGTERLTVMPDRTMTYSDTGRLYQLTENGTLKAEYIYNDLGQRTKKTLYQTDGITVASTTIYHYDQMGYLITETTETGTLIKDYIWNEMHPVAQIDAVIPAQAGIQSIETITYLYTDHLMTNRIATSQSKTIIWRWEGEAFGNTPAQELAGVSVNLRFPGQYYDQETNLHYNWNRYYDPTLGRYITSDPLGLTAGMNTYSYVNQNPIILYDFLGWTASCPPSPPRMDTANWRPYLGYTSLFHCGFEGYLEVRTDEEAECDDSPIGECFYDNYGVLVDKNHPYSGCRGTANDYAAYDPRHIWPDEGGLVKRGPEGWAESIRYKKDHSSTKPYQHHYPGISITLQR